MEKRMYTDVPAERDAEVPAAEMRLGGAIDALIAVDITEEESTFADVDPKRLAARANASLPLNEQLLKRNVKLIEIGNGLYPTSWRATRFGMSDDELRSTFWNGVNVDYNSLQQKGRDVAAAVAAGKEFQITSPSGTDLRVQRQGSVYVSDGIISADDVKKGGANVAVYLPAGEVATTVVAGTANGKVVVPLQYFQGQEVQNLVLTFTKGMLTSMTGSGPGFERMKAAYDASGAGKDRFGFVDLGINPNVRLGAQSKIATWVPAGTVTVGTGNNTWAGGDNNSAGGVTAFLSGCTVTLDGKTIVENGQLKL
jgi:leucyl aminopeptidase (aminopeptidase T)